MRAKDFLSEQTKYITLNRRLNPKLWKDGKMDLQVIDKLEKIAGAFEEFIGIDLNVVDVTVTGSNANYTWTTHSDLDLHLIVKGLPGEGARELFNAKKALWGEQHNITIKGLPVECYVQGEDEPHHSTGVYSLSKSKFLVEPKKVKPDVDDVAVTVKRDSIAHDVRTALIGNNVDELRKVKEKITKMRKAGLERAGEWSTENLVFKILRNLGLIDKITDKIRELEDQELSLEQQDPRSLDH
jgi:hypothetical protein